MKKLLIPASLVLSLFLGSCARNTDMPSATAQATGQNVKTFGDKIVPEKAIAATELTGMLDKQDSAMATVATNVLEVCQAKGCWMKVAVPGQEPIRVTFKNYGFFMPKDIAGKEVVFEGVAFRDTVSVADQRHFAEDAGQSKEEIEAITKAKPTITFIASGVQVKDAKPKE